MQGVSHEPHQDQIYVKLDSRESSGRENPRITVRNHMPIILNQEEEWQLSNGPGLQAH
jgi:hypothetical protein